MKLRALCFAMTFFNLVAMNPEKRGPSGSKNLSAKRQKTGILGEYVLAHEENTEKGHGSCTVQHCISDGADQLYNCELRQKKNGIIDYYSSPEDCKKSQKYYLRLVASRCRCGWIGLTSDLDDK